MGGINNARNVAANISRRSAEIRIHLPPLNCASLSSGAIEARLPWAVDATVCRITSRFCHRNVEFQQYCCQITQQGSEKTFAEGLLQFLQKQECATATPEPIARQQYRSVADAPRRNCDRKDFDTFFLRSRQPWGRT